MLDTKSGEQHESELGIRRRAGGTAIRTKISSGGAIGNPHNHPIATIVDIAAMRCAVRASLSHAKEPFRRITWIPAR